MNYDPNTEAPSNADPARTLRDFFGALGRWWWAILGITVIVAGAAFIYTIRQDNVYSAEADVLIERQSLANSLNNIVDTGAQVNEGPRVAQTQAQLAKSPEIAERTIKKLGITDLLPTDLTDNVTVTPDEASDVLHFVVEDKVQSRTAELTNEYANQYIIYRGEIELATIETAQREVKRRLASLERRGQTSGTLVDSLDQKRDTLETLAALQTSNAYIVHRATTADKVAPKPLLAITLGVTLGLLLGLGLALLLDAFDGRPRSPEALAEALGLRLVGKLPAGDDDPGAEPAMFREPAGDSAESYRSLRANIAIATRPAPFDTLMITAPHGDRAQTAAAVNLAIAEAGTGRKVTLAALDLRGDGFDESLGLGSGAGVAGVLGGAASAGDSTVDVTAFTDRSTGAGSLRAIGRGELPDDPGAMAGSRAVGELVETLAAESDVVIVNAPALLDYSDPIAISEAVDAVLVVAVLREMTGKDLSETKRLLESLPCPVVGVAVVA